MPFNDELKFEEAVINLLRSECGWETDKKLGKYFI